MQNTLNLFGDGDELDIVDDVERTFSIKLTEAEAEGLRNVGELHDLIELKFSAAKTQACLSQAAFYRLRKALNSMGVRREIRPQTPVSILEEVEPRSISRKWKLLSRTAKVELPILETPFGRWLPKMTAKNRWPVGALISALFAPPVIYLAEVLRPVAGISRGWAFFSVAVAVWALVACVRYLGYLTFRTIPLRLQTVGDIAREAAGYSFERLVADKSGSSPFDRWFALSAILRRISGHKRPITRDTTFFPKQAKSTS